MPGSGQRHSENKLTDASDPKTSLSKTIFRWSAIILPSSRLISQTPRIIGGSARIAYLAINIPLMFVSPRSVAPATINFHRRTQALLQIPIDKDLSDAGEDSTLDNCESPSRVSRGVVHPTIPCIGTATTFRSDVGWPNAKCRPVCKSSGEKSWTGHDQARASELATPSSCSRP